MYISTKMTSRDGSEGLDYLGAVVRVECKIETIGRDAKYNLRYVVSSRHNGEKCKRRLKQGYGITLVAFSANLVWTALQWALKIERIIGEVGARAVAKVASLLLAAIAVTMIRMGVEDALSRYWYRPAR
jgi:hypothetical protein